MWPWYCAVVCDGMWRLISVPSILYWPAAMATSTGRSTSLQWRHNGHNGVSSHLCLLNRLLRRRSKKTSKLRVTGPYDGNSPHKRPVTRKMFPLDDVIMNAAPRDGKPGTSMPGIDDVTQLMRRRGLHALGGYGIGSFKATFHRHEAIATKYRCAVKSNRQHRNVSWWRLQMETFSASLALCEGNPPVTGGFPAQRTVTRNFDVFFDLRLDKRLSKQSRRRWFETLF